MRIWNVIKTLAVHGCIIFSIVLLVSKILDWYNPLMNFYGQTQIIQYLLLLCAFLLGEDQIWNGKNTNAVKRRPKK